MLEKYLVIVYMHVGHLSKDKVAHCVAETKKNFTLDKPSVLTTIVIPQRDYETYIEVYQLGPDGEVPTEDEVTQEWLDNKYKEVQDVVYSAGENDPQSVTEYVKVMCGAPIIQLPDEIDNWISMGLELGERYKIVDLKAFVFDYVVSQRFQKV